MQERENTNKRKKHNDELKTTKSKQRKQRNKCTYDIHLRTKHESVS